MDVETIVGKKRNLIDVEDIEKYIIPVLSEKIQHSKDMEDLKSIITVMEECHLCFRTKRSGKGAFDFSPSLSIDKVNYLYEDRKSSGTCRIDNISRVFYIDFTE